MAWEDAMRWVGDALNGGTIQVAAAAITAIASAVLGFATWVLAKETKVLSRATSQAHVTVTLEPNPWAANFVDLIVSNSGNAVAYDIEASFEPPLPEGDEGPSHRRSMAAPLSHISVLRPAQTMQSNLCEFAKVSKKSYRVTITWAHHPEARKREKLSYELSMLDYHDVSYLGPRSPFTQIADQMKYLREDWRQIARGSKRIKTDVYLAEDRAKEEEAREALFQQMRDRDSGEPK